MNYHRFGAQLISTITIGRWFKSELMKAIGEKGIAKLAGFHFYNFLRQKLNLGPLFSTYQELFWPKFQVCIEFLLHLRFKTIQWCFYYKKANLSPNQSLFFNMFKLINFYFSLLQFSPFKSSLNILSKKSLLPSRIIILIYSPITMKWSQTGA